MSDYEPGSEVVFLCKYGKQAGVLQFTMPPGNVGSAGQRLGMTLVVATNEGLRFVKQSNVIEVRPPTKRETSSDER